ncbi:subtilisin-like serine protease [Ceratobasidium sp. 428]|nr:subtilisin-like serine protease [Ceratobasidium sp. 428]
MRGFSSCFVAALAAVFILGDVVAAVSVTMAKDEVNPGSYIIVLKDKVDMKKHKTWVDGERAKKAKGNSNSLLQITNDYDALNGYVAKLTPDTLDDLSNSPDVAMVVQDSRCEGALRQTDAPWGISRISRKTKLPPGSSVSNVNYIFNRKPSGAGVDVYVLDTGINTAHVDFGGRARWGATFGQGYKNADGHGHGTHVAGTVAGKRYGVAKAASLIAVKVLGDDNRGWNSDQIAGINWVVKQAKASGRPSILSASIYGGVDPAVNHAMTQAVNQGIHVVVCAGNKNDDARNYSPASAPAVITVGATNITDGRWVWASDSGSNYGPAVDIFAPGEDVTSTWIGSKTATNRITGTSMATPHVSGLVAYLLAVEGRRTPANMLARLKQLAPDGVLRGIPAGTRNEMIWNGGA